MYIHVQIFSYLTQWAVQDSRWWLRYSVLKVARVGEVVPQARHLFPALQQLRVQLQGSQYEAVLEKGARKLLPVPWTGAARARVGRLHARKDRRLCYREILHVCALDQASLVGGKEIVPFGSSSTSCSLCHVIWAELTVAARKGQGL